MIESNVLIAEFMGYKNKVNNGGIQIYELGKRGNKDYKILDKVDFKYHISWDWLMPVIEKVRYLNRHTCSGSNVFTTHIYECIRFKNRLETYKMVVKFIKWYNKN